MPAAELDLLLEEEIKRNSFRDSSLKRRGTKLPKKTLRRFSSSLARLLEGGVSLLKALQVIQGKSPRRSYLSLLKEVEEKVSQGESFSAALSSFPESFPNYFIQTLQAGELSGSVDKVLHTLALHLEKEEERMRKVKEALAYPVLVLTLAFLTLLILLQYVIPKIAALYGDYEASLPALTRFVLGLSSLALPLGIGFILSLGGVAFLWNRKKEAFLSFFFKLPFLNHFLGKTLLLQFSSLLSLLLESGIPILQAIQSLERTSSLAFFQKDLRKIESSLREGDGLSHSLENLSWIDNSSCALILSGEESGKLPDVLKQISKDSAQELESQTHFLLKLLEPLLILGVGLVVGVIVLSAILPILEINELVR